MVSKILQSKDMRIDMTVEHLKWVISFFENYRENGFTFALISAKSIASDMEIEPIFVKKTSNSYK